MIIFKGHVIIFKGHVIIFKGSCLLTPMSFYFSSSPLPSHPHLSSLSMPTEGVCCADRFVANQFHWSEQGHVLNRPRHHVSDGQNDTGTKHKQKVRN